MTELNRNARPWYPGNQLPSGTQTPVEEEDERKVVDHRHEPSVAEAYAIREVDRAAALEAQRVADEAERQEALNAAHIAQCVADEAERQEALEAQRVADEAERQEALEVHRAAALAAQRVADEADRAAALAAQRVANETRRAAALAAQRAAYEHPSPFHLPGLND